MAVSEWQIEFTRTYSLMVIDKDGLVERIKEFVDPFKAIEYRRDHCLGYSVGSRLEI